MNTTNLIKSLIFFLAVHTNIQEKSLYLNILNIHAKRIELLDSLIDGRKKRMDAFIEKLVNIVVIQLLM